MPDLIFSAITTLDGYVADAKGRFEWCMPDEEVGGGLRALPDGVRLDLEPVDERRFGNGFVHLRHRVLTAPVCG